MPRRPERQAFVSVDWLAEHLQDPTIRIIDARFVYPHEPEPSGEEQYAAGHIPGAVFLHWRKDLSVNTPPVPNMLLGPEAFAARIGQAGIDNNTTVIVYDRGDVIWAARIWWALRHYGHDTVFVLEGGATAWQAAEQPWTTEVVQPAPKTFVPHPRPDMWITKEQMLAAVNDPNITILETRRSNNIVEAGGTVKGAYLLSHHSVFASRDGHDRRLIEPEQLDAYLHEIGADQAPRLVAT